MENICLLTLALSKDVKKYGIDRVLAPSLADLKILESKGIVVKYKNKTMYFTRDFTLVLTHTNDTCKILLLD